MRSAGNDIVALTSINKERTHNNRFYRQILAVEEQALFHALVNTLLSFDKFVWLAWSVKESAYKYFRRLHPQLVFSPTKITIQSVHLIGENAVKIYLGTFAFENKLYHFKSQITNEVIASIVNDEAHFDKINWGIRKIYPSNSADQSKEVRIFILEALTILFPGKPLQVSLSNGQPPVITCEGKVLDIPASFAHHGSFISYAFVRPLTPVN